HDRSALLAFKAGITADPSGLLRSWDSATDCCSAWDGVACNAATRRVALDLHGNHLTGSIPMEIGLLRRLTILDLSENKISGGIPRSIGKLETLIVLDRVYNRLVSQLYPD
ncbi:unnamed protein product, partial [Musa hybrid cultivar]